MEDYESDIDVPRGVETTIEVQMSPRPPRTRAITTAVVAALLIGGGAYVGHLSQQNHDAINADISNGVLVDNNDPRFLRGKIEAIGADVLYGVGAIVAVTAVFGFFAHGPDSTGVADQQEGQPHAHDGPGRRRALAVGAVLMRAARRVRVRRRVLALAARRLRLAQVRRPEEEDAGRRASRAPSGYAANDDFGPILLRAAAAHRRIGGGPLRRDGDAPDVGRGRLVRRRRPARAAWPSTGTGVRRPAGRTDHGDRAGAGRAAGAAGRARTDASATCW